MATAIEFNHVGKQYRLGVVSTRTLSHDFNRWWQTAVLKREDPYLKIGETNDRTTLGNSEYVWALRDIDFKIEQGDVVGIIGKNGAGKSTLLKLLSKVTGPTVGSIRARGTIGTLLEVGTGFHPEMTGRENIYMNGAIMGMTKAEVARKLDEIIDFSGCERYIDTPVKRYSSGMTVRLGFAVAAHLDPEILVVDEVLAVGDAEFQKKAIGKMQSVSQGEGRTVLFVSHNMASIRALCKNGIVLKNGRIDYMGNVADAVDFYINNIQDDQLIQSVTITNAMRDMNRSLTTRFVSISQHKDTCKYASDEDIVLIIKIISDKKVPDCRINCTIFSSMDVPVCCNSSFDVFCIDVGEEKTIEYTIHNPGLAAGKYSISFSVGVGNMSTGETNYDIVQKVIRFEIDKISKETDLQFVKWNTSAWGSICLKSSIKCID
jgi:lipopolysaccharide transport system ATP-binding protein